MLKKVILFPLLAFLLLLAEYCGISQTFANASSSKNTIKIVVDSYHSHNFINLPPDVNLYDYHYLYGFRHLFRYLESRGVKIDEITTGPINKNKIENADMFFINLTSMDMPPFRMSEIKAIKQYVESGGSLLVVTDHSNCYYHAYKLAQLFEELGLEVTTETACDKAPQTLANGNGWIVINHFQAHEITKNLKAVAMMTGGTVDDRYGIAFTSDAAWGDQWIVHPYGEGDAQGFYGNWALDKGERTGKMAVMLAKNFGRGRIFVVGDQNMWGDAFCNYADNYKLWLNSVAWLTGEKQLADPESYEKWQKPHVVLYENYQNAAWGNCDDEGFFNLFVALEREYWVFASNNLVGDPELIIFAHDGYGLSEGEIKGFLKHLKSGKNIIVLNSSLISSGKSALIEQLADKLGEPRIDEYQKEASYNWAGTGSVILFKESSAYINKTIPHPQQRPNDNQKADLDYLIARLDQYLH
ncbi:MAG: DUF4350 domain-containing protein [Acidaminococcaceae bacterium]